MKRVSASEQNIDIIMNKKLKLSQKNGFFKLRIKWKNEF